ncbi:hypothetical protein [Bifidobacterium sp. SO1]|uniref:hypothetical protein n=1 Tax=Bifidobacterium sp. SO1 TaxID=2809029 RepID=UPI001BDCEBBA|nr:hypothetical protein [Bifidobacterium sp. SO1]MBT1161682.1 hypothetical protein [Bifidobacterium sp. SO1]
MKRRYLILRTEPHTVLVFDDKKTRDLYWNAHDRKAWWIDQLVAREEMIRATGLPWNTPMGEIVDRYLTDHPDRDLRGRMPDGK